MVALSKLLTIGGTAAAAAGLASSAPASAQYYPGYGYPYGGDIVGQVLNSVIGNGYGYGANRQIAINQCANAAQARLGTYGSARVLGISEASPRSDGGIFVRGVASSGRYSYDYRYGYGSGMQSPDLTWRCRTDFRGFIRDVTIDRPNYGNGYNSTQWDDDYSRFGYRRY
ncbi:MAG: hypothetical protein NVS3B5_23660 [Sphingomicrobium sp.]